MRASALIIPLILATPAGAMDDAVPDAELLNFLAEMQEEAGDRFNEWLDQEQPEFEESGGSRDD